MTVDYSLYLVTDNTSAILGSRSLVDVVRSAVEGGESTGHVRYTHDMVVTKSE